MIVPNIQVNTHFTYKAYIGKGNNGVLVRAALKNRWWWTQADQADPWEDLNLCWM